MGTSIKYIGREVEQLKGSESESDFVLPYFSVDQVRALRSVFGFLNDKDRDILFLIFVSRKKQNDVQRILRRSQPSLCYDIKRIRRRLKFIFYLYSVFDIFVNFVENHASEFDSDEMEVLTLMFYTSSYTMTAGVLGSSHVKVRSAFNRCLRKLETKALWEVYEIFNIIRQQLNIVKRVYKGEKRGIDHLVIL